MATISRLKAAEISNGNVINADDIEAELDQLVSEHNSKETRLDDLETGTMSITGVKTFSDGIKTDTVDEETSAAGVTIDGVLLKDNFMAATYLSGAGVNAQTGTTYTVLTGDRNKLVTFSNASAIAVTLPEAGSVGFASNYVFTAVNLGAGLVTITPTTSTIDGASTITLSTNQGVTIFSDGTNYFTNRGRSTAPGSELLFSGSGTSVAAVEVDTDIDWTKYHNYRITGYFLPVTDGADLYIRTSTDGGSTYDSGASDYQSSVDSAGIGAASYIRAGLTSFIGNGANEGAWIDLIISKPADASYTNIMGVCSGYTTSGTYLVCDVGGVRESAADVNGIQLLMSSGNIASYNLQIIGEGAI